MTINFNKVYPSSSNCEVVHSWNEYGSVCVEKVVYEGAVFSYDFCVADKVYINLVSTLFDPKKYLWSEPAHQILTKEFNLEDLNSIAEQMGISVSQDKEQVAKDIIKEIENVISVKLNKTPCSKMKRVIVEEDGLVMEMTKNIEFDFSKYDYLPDMVDFMEDVKYMFDNHNSPNNYPFTKVQLAFDRMFQKGVVQAEEVKNGLGETFQSFMSVWIEAYSLMIRKECQLKEFFMSIEEGLYVKDILPFVAKVIKEKYTG